MQTQDLQAEITALEFQIDYQEKRLDIALKNDLQFGESKKLFQEIKILKGRLNELNNHSSGSS